MSRTREYDPDIVIDAAVNTFWKHGYEGTSVRDLAKSCGLTTRSMYNAYPDKDKFFEAALDRYHTTVLNPVLHLIESGRGLDALKSFVNLLSTAANRNGCLFVNTAMSRHLVSDVASAKVEKYLKHLRKCIQNKLEEARKDGLFNGDSELRATQLVMGALGFSVSLRAGVPQKEAAAAFRQIVADISGG